MAIRKRFWQDTGRTKIKICGIMTLDIAYETSYLGADALGFHLWQGSDVERRASRFKYIVRFLPDDISCWLLTDITNHDLLKRFISEIGVDTVQFQGKTSHADFARIIHKLESLRTREKIKFVKSISMSSRNHSKIMSALNSYVGYVDAVLLDSKWKGGTGATHDWGLSCEIVRAVSKPAILAGGLTPENIAHAITTVKPYGVDVESGVENVVGSYRKKKIKCKSIIKIRDFIVNAKDVSRYL